MLSPDFPSVKSNFDSWDSLVRWARVMDLVCLPTSFQRALAQESVWSVSKTRVQVADICFSYLYTNRSSDTLTTVCSLTLVSIPFKICFNIVCWKSYWCQWQSKSKIKVQLSSFRWLIINSKLAKSKLIRFHYLCLYTLLRIYIGFTYMWIKRHRNLELEGNILKFFLKSAFCREEICDW